MSDVAAALVGMMRASELTLEDLAAYLEAEGAPGITTSAPTLRENAAKVLSGLKQGTAKDCRPHVRRLCEGELRQCSCTCVKCVERWATTGTCMCACTKCADAITFEGLGDRRLRPKSISSTELAQLPEVARRISAKRAVQHNLNRAKKGLAAKPSHGQGGQEMCATAVKKVFEMAVKDEHLNRTPAEDLEKGDRSEPRRTSLSDDQLIELFHVVVSGGDDPELDFDITWTEFETCFRRGGLLSLTVGRLMRERQGIEVLEKRNKTRIEPCSAELLDALFEMAAERGGTRCVPGRPDCDPNASVFYFKDSTPQHPHPLTDRRFDTLHGRIQRALPWANEALYSGHALRHTTSTMIDRIAGMRVAQKMWVTDRRGRATTTRRRRKRNWRRRGRSSRAGPTLPPLHLNARERQRATRIVGADCRSSSRAKRTRWWTLRAIAAIPRVEALHAHDRRSVKRRNSGADPMPDEERVRKGHLQGPAVQNRVRRLRGTAFAAQYRS